MTPPICLRRHTDGRVAILDGGGQIWTVLERESRRYTDEREILSEGWSELFVAELPEPDGWTECVGDKGEDAGTPYWHTRRGTFTAWTDGVEDDWGLNENERIEDVRTEALKMLAAVATCERYRAEREAT